MHAASEVIAECHAWHATNATTYPKGLLLAHDASMPRARPQRRKVHNSVCLCQCIITRPHQAIVAPHRPQMAAVTRPQPKIGYKIRARPTSCAASRTILLPPHKHVQHTAPATHKANAISSQCHQCNSEGCSMSASTAVVMNEVSLLAVYARQLAHTAKQIDRTSCVGTKGQNCSRSLYSYPGMSFGRDNDDVVRRHECSDTLFARCKRACHVNQSTSMSCSSTSYRLALVRWADDMYRRIYRAT